ARLAAGFLEVMSGLLLLPLSLIAFTGFCSLEFVGPGDEPWRAVPLALGLFGAFELCLAMSLGMNWLARCMRAAHSPGKTRSPQAWRTVGMPLAAAAGCYSTIEALIGMMTLRLHRISLVWLLGWALAAVVFFVAWRWMDRRFR